MRRTPAEASGPPTGCVFFVFFRCVERRTGLLGVQVAVSYGESCREVAAQLLQQLREGSLLGRRASGSREAFAVQSPFVADADAVAVVTEAVRPLQGERPAGMYPAVACDVVMVADVAEVPAVDMVPAAILERVRLPAARGAAMDDE